MLLQRVENHLKRLRMAPSRFGREALGDPKLVFDLREGRELRARTAQRLIDYLDGNAAEQLR
jgi:2,4-dienoyl-CoA reductase-like NADH-dependent reductase (Old Yellow Enzyme family)